MVREAAMDQRESIRSLFLDKRESYGLPEVARLTGTPLRKLRREVAGNYRDGQKVGGFWRLTWRQAVDVALEAWTLAEIHDALGCDARAVLPPLLALRSVTVRLPEFILRALERIAAESNTTLDHALHGELIDFAGTMAGRMDRIAPGYRAAYLFPSPSHGQNQEQAN
jgi:hypothetical protein